MQKLLFTFFFFLCCSVTPTNTCFGTLTPAGLNEDLIAGLGANDVDYDGFLGSDEEGGEFDDDEETVTVQTLQTLSGNERAKTTTPTEYVEEEQERAEGDALVPEEDEGDQSTEEKKETSKEDSTEERGEEKGEEKKEEEEEEEKNGTEQGGEVEPRKRQFVLPEVPSHYEEVARKILNQMDIYDLGKVRMSTLSQLPPRAVLSIKDLRSRMPPAVYRNMSALSKQEMAVGIANLLNDLSTRTLRKIGPNWLDIVPKLPEQTWRHLDERVVENIPWRGLVANLETSVWGQLSFVMFNRLPNRFFRHSPFKLWAKVPPAKIARFKPSKLNIIRSSYLRRFKWKKIASFLRDASIFNKMSKPKLLSLPWRRMMASLPADVVGQMNSRVLSTIPSASFKNISLRQFRSIGPRVLEKMPTESLKRVNIRFYKSLPNSHLRAIGAGRLRLITKGEITLDKKTD